MEEVMKLLNLIKNDIDSIKIDISLMKSLQVFQIEKQKCIENKLSEVENQVRNLYEKDSLKNIILYNVQDNEENNKALISNVQKIIKKAEINISDLCIGDIQRIGRKKVNSNRPVVIKLLAPRWKHEFFEKEEKLKSMGYKISSDVSKEKRKLKSMLLKARYLLRKDGKNPILRNYKLFIENYQLTENEIILICDGKSFVNATSSATPISNSHDNSNPTKESKENSSKTPQITENKKANENIESNSNIVNKTQQIRNTRSTAKKPK